MLLEIKKAIGDGIGYLETQQQPDGSFLSFSVRTGDFKNKKIYHSVFPVSLILSCLNNIGDSSAAKRIKKKAAAFLLSQKSPHWSFNYWTKESKEAKIMPYPDDLDDTFCALSALFQFDAKLINGAAMAKIITLLTILEEKTGGPYRTWVVPQTVDPIWQDVDLAVNSNIAYFLSLHDISLTKLTSFIESAVDKKSYYSPYYPSAYPILYFIARFYRGGKVNRLKQALLEKVHSSQTDLNPLEIALTVSALLNLDEDSRTIEKQVSCLIKQQKKGVWQTGVFCFDPAIKRQPYFAGSSALTTAFCLEALSKYLQVVQKQQNEKDVFKQNKAILKKQRRIEVVVLKKVRQRFVSLNKELKALALLTLKQLMVKDKEKQIILLPYFFKEALGQNGKDLTEDFLVTLGVANLYGWLAYNIYDDFLDLEGNAQLLPIANLALRELSMIFSTLLPQTSSFAVIFEEVMDNLEEANVWEVSHCRVILNDRVSLIGLPIPDYGDLSQLAVKSLGHILGPLAILFSLGFTKQSSEFKNSLRFFKHYLIARQLNDDVHDWEKDLRMGQINAVGAIMLKQIKHKQSRRALDWSEMEEFFWDKTVVIVCNKILRHIKLSRKALYRNQLIVKKDILDRLLFSVEQSALEALEERKNTKLFLKYYSSC